MFFKREELKHSHIIEFEHIWSFERTEDTHPSKHAESNGPNRGRNQARGDCRPYVILSPSTSMSWPKATISRIRTRHHLLAKELAGTHFKYEGTRIMVQKIWLPLSCLSLKFNWLRRLVCVPWWLGGPTNLFRGYGTGSCSFLVLRSNTGSAGS